MRTKALSAASCSEYPRWARGGAGFLVGGFLGGLAGALAGAVLSPVSGRTIGGIVASGLGLAGAVGGLLIGVKRPEC